ncbi:MAG: choice-of-anchor X domain-containing protein [Myxococcota bacterium]
MWLLLFAPGLATGLPTEAEVFAGVLARFDADGNGTISEPEYTRFDTAANFASIDQDASGGIDQDELTAWVKVTQPRPLRGEPDGRGKPDGRGERSGEPEMLVQVVDLARRARPDGAPAPILAMEIGGATAVSLNDGGEGVDIAAGDGVYSGLASVPAPGAVPVRVRAGTATWSGDARFDAATANTAAPLALGADGVLAAHVGSVPIGGAARGAPPSASALTTAPPAAASPAAASPAETPPAAAPGAPESSLLDGWPLYAGILGVGLVAGTWIELRGRRRRRRRR